MLGGIAEHDVRSVLGERHRLLEGVILRAPIQKIRGRDVEAGKSLLWVAFFEIDELLRLRIRQRSQQYGVYHREDAGVCANAERENKNDKQTETCVFTEHAHGEPQVLQKFLDHR